MALKCFYASTVQNNVSKAGIVNMALPISLSFWFKVDNGSLAGNGIILNARTGGENLVKYWNYGVTIITPGIDISQGYGDGTNYKYNTWDTNLATGIYHHVVMIFTSTYFYIYINGGASSSWSTTGALSLYTTSTTLYLGRNGGTANVWLAEVGIWNVQLTDAEANALYALGRYGMPLMIQPAGLKAYYRLDDWNVDAVAAGSAKDLSGNANHIDVVNSPVAADIDRLNYPEMVIN